MSLYFGTKRINQVGILNVSNGTSVETCAVELTGHDIGDCVRYTSLDENGNLKLCEYYFESTASITITVVKNTFVTGSYYCELDYELEIVTSAHSEDPCYDYATTQGDGGGHPTYCVWYSFVNQNGSIETSSVPISSGIIGGWE